MLFLGFIVASILISMYLPMFDLVNAVSGTGN
jgi:type II secretory pathway component PulF